MKKAVLLHIAIYIFIFVFFICYVLSEQFSVISQFWWIVIAGFISSLISHILVDKRRNHD